MSGGAARIVLTTAGTSDEAVRIGRALVEERLAACVNVVPGVRSIYRWQGAVADEAEWLLVVKIRAERFAEVAERIRELHSYEVPEVLAIDVADGSPAYLAWLLGEG